ncbi:hypothetical protein [Streptomyces griseorubiginosus]|uniref:hypothetical protein n=1 Tax=Streptomyces griseorubiginosus TaxID=67304 RepID=UPI0036589154
MAVDSFGEAGITSGEPVSATRAGTPVKGATSGLRTAGVVGQVVRSIRRHRPPPAATVRW